MRCFCRPGSASRSGSGIALSADSGAGADIATGASAEIGVSAEIAAGVSTEVGVMADIAAGASAEVGVSADITTGVNLPSPPMLGRRSWQPVKFPYVDE